MKVLFLWSHSSGYLEDSLKEVAMQGAEVHLVHYENMKISPFDLLAIRDPRVIHHVISGKKSLDIGKLKASIEPDLVFISGWNHLRYITLRKSKKEKWIICFDNQLVIGFKHLALSIIFRCLKRIRMDYAFVPGERQALLASSMGFKDSEIKHGLYAIDTAKYATHRQSCKKEFIFVGRLVPEKGFRELIEGYIQYRSWVSEPWELRICGEGPLRGDDLQGLIWDGFTQPNELIGKLKNAGFLLLPSHFEAWGVVINEGLASGLPIVTSNNCGAARSLVSSGWNGIVMHNVSPLNIALALLECHEMNEQDYLRMSRNSLNISTKTSVKVFARSIFEFQAAQQL
jgi:glycosyltransferase involved in cell wall biosynthesis